MGLRMKNFNIMGVYWEIRFLGGVHEKLIQGNCLKLGGLGQFADLSGGGGLGKKERGGAFLMKQISK